MKLNETPIARAVFGLSMALLASAAMAQSYRLEAVPLVSSDDSTYGYLNGAPSMNNVGDLVWTRLAQITFPIDGYELEYLGARATLYRNQAYVRDIVPLAPGENRATGINDHGAVIGRSFSVATELVNGPRGSTLYTNQHAFLSQNGQATDLGATLGGVDYGYSTATAINNQGQVVGYVGSNEMYGGDCCDSRKAFIYSNGQMTSLGNLLGSTATDINDHSVVVGSLFVPNENSPVIYTSYGGYIAGSFHAFSYQNGSVTDLSGANSIGFSYANAINNLGAVVGGISDLPAGVEKAALFHDGVTTVLGSGVALDINDAGLIVGDSSDGHGFLYRDGQMIDLSTLLTQDFQGWLVTSAIEINNAGIILAQAKNPVTGLTQYVQLSAVPEPQSVALAIAGLLIVAGAGRASRKRLT